MGDENESDNGYDPSDAASSSIVSNDSSSKRRSARISKQKKEKNKTAKQNNKKKRKREESVSESVEVASVDSLENRERKKRKKSDSEIEKAAFRQMKREFVRLWIDKQYVAAIHLAEDEYAIQEKHINEWIEDIYDFDL